MAKIEKKFKINKIFDDETLGFIAEDIVDRIVKRTKSGIDKNGDSFPEYSEAYKKSDDFKFGGKTSKVNLTLTGEMLDMLSVLSVKDGVISIGLEGDDELIGKAEGNIKGSYGKRPDKSKARDFLGLPEKEIKKIINRYADREERREIKDSFDKIYQEYKRTVFEYDEEDE